MIFVSNLSNGILNCYLWFFFAEGIQFLFSKIVIAIPCASFEKIQTVKDTKSKSENQIFFAKDKAFHSYLI